MIMGTNRIAREVGAHLLRERPACYTCFDSGLETAAAAEPGKASARQEGI